MKIISLVENTSKREDICCEHGLSLYIEASGKRILFDMGQSDMLFYNAERLGVSLSDVDIAILSHGHYDHGGGLKKFLQINKTAKIYVRESAFLPYYHGERYIGLDPTLEDEPRLIKLPLDLKISEGLTLCGPDSTPEDTDGLTVEIGGERLADLFDHEQYLLIEEAGRRVLISGCSHKGILNIIEHFKPNILIGGFHLMNKQPGEELRELAVRLGNTDCDYYTCHCTGKEQFDFIKKYLKRLEYLSAGDRIEM